MIAAEIKKVAREHGVPIAAAPPLTRALFFSTELGDEIPAGLYMAVAQVLAYVFQLKASARGGPVPNRPGKVDISDDYFQGPGTGTGHERKANDNGN